MIWNFQGGEGCDSPFRWWVFDNSVCTLSNSIPEVAYKGWEARYANEYELGKRSLRDPDAMPNVAGQVLNDLMLHRSSADWSNELGYPVIADSSLHGGGFQVTKPGGELAVHLDYDRHPLLPGWRRALNVIAFVHDEWELAWGGALALCDPMGEVVERIMPWPKRVVAFECSDLSYHGVEPITGPAERASVSVSYLTVAGPTNTRLRALFLPNRKD